MKRVRLIYFTDPICSTCWLAEPYLYRLQKIWGDALIFEIRMGGLLPSHEEAIKTESILSNMQAFTSQLKELSKLSGMHLDASFWEHNPVSSSYPACIAYHAAKISAPELAGNYLRTLREMLYTESKDISNRDWLEEAAIRNNICRDDFRSLLNDGSAEKAFQRDLRLKAELGVKRFPTLIFETEDGQRRIIENQAFKTLHGIEILEYWNSIISELLNLPIPPLDRGSDVEQIELLFNEFDSLTTAEIAIKVGISESETFSLLNQASQSGKLHYETHLGLNIWRKNDGTFRWKKTGMKISNTAIVGAGIAGLALSIGLNKIGIPNTLYERSKSDSGSGFGFLILENGLKALEFLGLKSHFLKLANPICNYKAIAPDGSLLRYSALEKCYAISRQDLLGILNTATNQEFIHYEKALSMIEQTESAVKACFGNESQKQFDAVFACDGFYSEIRSRLMPEFKPQPTSEKELVCLVDTHSADFRLIEFTKIIDTAQRCNTGIIPLRNGKTLWFMQLNEAVFPIKKKDNTSLYELACEISASYPEAVRDLIHVKSKNAPIYFWNSHRMDLMPAFHKGDVCLLGDAAHPLLAFTSQGANSALEDAVTLATLLGNAKNEANIKDIYSAYYSRRRESISAYIKQGDDLLQEFLSLGTQGAESIPLAIH